MKRALTTIALLLSAFSVSAEIVEVEYKRFYSHVNKVGDEDTSALQFAFGFIRVGTKNLCEINKATIVTQKKDIPLTVTPEHRFLVPKEKALKLADAMVMIELGEAANLCDMSVQLETKPEFLKTQYSSEELALIYTQYEHFFDDMGSFLSFLMPSVNGLKIIFADKSINQPITHTQGISNGELELSADWLSAGHALMLPVKPLRITAVASD